MVICLLQEGFTEEQKIHVTANLVDDVLSHAIDSNSLQPSKQQQSTTADGAETHSPCEETMEDVFIILRSPLLRVGTKKSDTNAGDDDADMEMDEATANGQAAVAKAKSQVLKKLSKQHLVSHLLPVVASLKHTLESFKSPIQGALMEYLIFLMKHNKSEVDQSLSNDPCLRSEIEYDLKQYHKAQEAAAALRQHQQAIAQAVAQQQASASKAQASPAAPLSSSMSARKVIPKSSIKKSVHSQQRTPMQALRAVGKSSVAAGAEDEDEDDVNG
jgi:hypothetical protein